ncbi:hypothetical protein [Flavobacterium sp.]|uniref:hypothetical protein n=1 Tax=Flavobacterium sp. TaxID=239 RepID=UPI003D1227E1
MLRILLALLLISTVTFSQTLTGKVSDNQIALRANIYIRDIEKDNVISEYFKTDSIGRFQINLKKEYKKIKLEVSAYGYEIASETLFDFDKSKNYTFDFKLVKKSKILDEVVIKNEKVVVKKDTVVYNPKMYSDGTERKLGEILTKIPGFEVNNGNIKYNGKTVTALKIEDDDLFGKDYAVGTKNISLAMIDKIEAIDNFSANPLLKGIENSDVVAINLKLKKGSFGVSGDCTYGSGYDSNIKPRNDLNLNNIFLINDYKSFFQFGYNNVGENYSQIEPIYKKTKSFFDEEDVFAKSLLNDIKVSKRMDLIYSSENNELEGNYNFLVKFNKKTNLKTELYASNDAFTQFERNQSFFSNNVVFDDSNNYSYKPFSKKIKLTLNSFFTSKSLLIVENQFQEDNVNSFLLQNQNNLNLFKTDITTYSFFEKIKIDLTKRLNENTALTYSTITAYHNLPQNLTIKNDENASFFSFQESNFKKVSILNKLVVLGNYRGLKYSFSAGFNYKEVINSSKLISSDTFNSTNDVKYNTKDVFSEFGLFYKYKDFSVAPSVKVFYVNQALVDEVLNNENEKRATYLNSNLLLKYVFLKKNRFVLAFNNKHSEPNDGNLFTNFIISSNRNVLKYNHSLRFQRNQSVDFTYRFIDEEKHINIMTNLSYTVTNNNLISENAITDNYFVSTFFQSENKQYTKSIDSNFEKLISPLKTVIKGGLAYSISDYNNIFEGENRNNIISNLSCNVFFSTILEFPLNFHYKILYNKFSSTSNNNLGFENKSLENQFKMICKFSKKAVFSSQLKFISPNLANGNTFKIVDCNFKFKIPKLKDFDFVLKGNNILNVENYFENTATDIQNTYFQSNIIPRHFLLYVTFKF